MLIFEITTLCSKGVWNYDQSLWYVVSRRVHCADLRRHASMAPDQTPQIRELELEARQVLDKVNVARKEGRGPLFVEFSGTPKAGKSTIINSLRLFLARNDFKVFVLTERASTCPIRDKQHPFFNVWTACATLTQLLAAAQAGRDDVVIMDRGLFDALVWMRWLQDKESLDSSQRVVIEGFLTLDLWINLIDLIFIMKVSPDEALKREFGGQVTRKFGSIMNPETIREFNDALERTVNANVPFKNMLEVDTTNEQPEETSYQVVRKTLRALDSAFS